MNDFALLTLRFLSGVFMIYGHGWPKVKRLFGENEITFADPLGIGVIPSLVLATFAEAFCSLFVMAGLLSRIALIPLMITMFTAAFIHHGNDPFKVMEPALLYLLIYITLFITGPGKYSIRMKKANRSGNSFLKFILK